MQKRIVWFCLVICLASPLSAKPWVLIAGPEGFSVLDLGLVPNEELGFWRLSPLAELFDVEPYPNNCGALFSSGNAGFIFRVDTTDPNHPFQSGSLDLSGIAFTPGDIAIPKQGGFAVVDEGEYLNRLVFIDLTDPDFKTYSLYRLQTAGARADAVTVTPDGQTVIVCDAYHDRIIFGRVNAEKSGLESENVLPTASLPVNVSISPDGRTALVTDAYGAVGYGGRISVFRIDGPGAVVPGSPPELFAAWYPQSVAFSPDGTMAYVYSTSYLNLRDSFSFYSIDGPGRVSYAHLSPLDLMSKTGFFYFGVDVLAVTPDGLWAIVGGSMTPVGYNVVALDILVEGARYLLRNKYPRGLAMLDEAIVYPPADATCTRLVNDFIFYKEYINRLTWRVNPENLAIPTTVRLYRKNFDAPDSDFQLLGEFDPSITSYDDRGLHKDQVFVYRFTSVLATGKESAPADVEAPSEVQRIIKKGANR